MQKKLVLAVMVLMGLSACSVKERVVEMQEVRLSVCGDIVSRAGTVAGVFTETAPTGAIELRVIGEGVDLVIEEGATIEVPVGVYRVTGLYEPQRAGYGPVYGSAEPRYSVDSELRVKKGQTEYAVDAKYECWALVMDFNYVSAYKYGTKYLDSYGVGTYTVLYIWPSEAVWTMTVVPSDDDVYGVTEAEIRGADMVNGKWYAFYPGRLSQSGGIGVNFPEWEPGE